LTLTLPDICAALEDRDGRTDSKKYKAWYKSNIFDKIGTLSPDEAWEFRNTVVHQSKAIASEKRAYSRIIFTMPDAAQHRVDSMVTNDAMTFDVEMFCNRWIGAVRIWIEASKDNQTVQDHLPDLLQVRPQGLAPHIVGMPIIA
jgi:hypothetical protein